MNGSLFSADRATHVKIVVLELIAATAIILGAIATRVGASNPSFHSASAQVLGPVVKAGIPLVVAATEMQVAR